MTQYEFQYIKKALNELEKPMTIQDRIKVQKVMAQILTKSAKKLEEELVDNLAV
jgi:hypothetical protein